MAAVGRHHEREVAAFDEGELWCDDSAQPPLSPAGWYFRERRGSPSLWIGPFPQAEDAREAPFSGDPLRDARRYLDLWRRGEPVPERRPALTVAAARRETPNRPPTGQLELAGGKGAAPAPSPKAPVRRAARSQQFTFGF